MTRRSLLLRLCGCIGAGFAAKAPTPWRKPATFPDAVSGIWAERFERMAKQGSIFSCLDGATGDDGHAIIICHRQSEASQWGVYEYRIIDPAKPHTITFSRKEP